MRMFRPVVVLGLCVLASACATPRGNDTAVETAPQVVEATAVEMQASEATTPQLVNAPAPDVATDDAVIDEEQTLAESDFAAIYGEDASTGTEGWQTAMTWVLVPIQRTQSMMWSMKSSRSKRPSQTGISRASRQSVM